MHIHPKSVALWLGGATVGGIVGGVVSARGSSLNGTLGGAVLGAILLGAVGDKVLEQEQRTGVFSVVPLRWKYGRYGR